MVVINIRYVSTAQPHTHTLTLTQFSMIVRNEEGKLLLNRNEANVITQK